MPRKGPVFGPPIRMEDLTPSQRLHVLATPAPGDPRMAWATEVRMEPLLEAVARANRDAETLISPLHVMVKAVDRAVAAHPAFGLRIVRGQVRPYGDRRVLVPVQTATGARAMLLERVDEKSVADISAEMWRRLLEPGPPDVGRGLHRRRYPFERVFGVHVAGALFRLGLRAMDRFGARLGGYGPGPGSPVLLDYLGSADVAPMTSHLPSRLPMEYPATTVTVGRPVTRPVVEDGAVVPGEVSSVTVQADHRFVDALELGRFVATLRRGLEDPAPLFEPAGDEAGEG